MYYEINVSKNGRHYFATAERSITSFTQAEGLYKIFKEKFPERIAWILNDNDYQNKTIIYGYK